MKFFTTSQIRQLDQYTIEQEPIDSIDLMERAANAIYERYLQTFDYRFPVCIIAGPGNNGGDALALARIMQKNSYHVNVVLIHAGKLSTDCEINKQRLMDQFPASLEVYENKFIAPNIAVETIIIDGLFGSGLTRPLSGIFAKAVKWMNESGNKILSIDIPSGLQGEENTDLTVPIVKADYTFSFQFPKLAFLLPESAAFAGNWEVLVIGIHPNAISETESKFNYLQESEIKQLIKIRPKFSHKGTYGHLLIVAGCKGMAGASVLAAKAALRSGVGLVTVHGPKCNRVIMQTAVNESIFISDKNKNCITEVQNLNNYSSLAVGPGIGTSPETVKMVEHLLLNWTKPCIIDADGLNIIAQLKTLLDKIPAGSILTPHPKEFERLFGVCKNSYERIQKASEMAVKYKLILILKGAHTLIAQPDGQLFFNSTGNSGMATAGAGDVLTGILGSLLSQGYTPENAAKLGVYLHGLAGDLALNEQSEESLIAEDIILNTGRAFKEIKRY
ncbi:MAG TPA: NAD(P)H-hydrate dehydratase [Paludibacter sp.]|nr:NAD(P)H-hydrate dehydratase [Paludibacter sp.]